MSRTTLNLVGKRSNVKPNAKGRGSGGSWVVFVTDLRYLAVQPTNFG